MSVLKSLDLCFSLDLCGTTTSAHEMHRTPYSTGMAVLVTLAFNFASADVGSAYSDGVPQIVFTANGKTNLVLRVGDPISYSWNVTGATSVSSYETTDGPYCGLPYPNAPGQIPWTARSSKGSSSTNVSTCQGDGTFFVSIEAIGNGGRAHRTIAIHVLGNEINAAALSGSDCGARINLADQMLGSRPGEILVDRSCGTLWTTQVELHSHHSLVFTDTSPTSYAFVGAPGRSMIRVYDPNKTWGVQTVPGRVGVHVVGAGARLTILRAASAMDTVVGFDNCADCGLENLTVDGSTGYPTIAAMSRQDTRPTFQDLNILGALTRVAQRSALGVLGSKQGIFDTISIIGGGQEALALGTLEPSWFPNDVPTSDGTANSLFANILTQQSPANGIGLGGFYDAAANNPPRTTYLTCSSNVHDNTFINVNSTWNGTNLGASWADNPWDRNGINMQCANNNQFLGVTATYNYFSGIRLNIARDNTFDNVLSYGNGLARYSVNGHGIYLDWGAPPPYDNSGNVFTGMSFGIGGGLRGIRIYRPNSSGNTFYVRTRSSTIYDDGRNTNMYGPAARKSRHVRVRRMAMAASVSARAGALPP